MIAFPATPQEMHLMLLLESRIKGDGGLTHRGMNGYLYAEGDKILTWKLTETKEVVVRSYGTH
jgi:hypothetical protein